MVQNEHEVSLNELLKEKNKILEIKKRFGTAFPCTSVRRPRTIIPQNSQSGLMSGCYAREIHGPNAYEQHRREALQKIKNLSRRALIAQKSDTHTHKVGVALAVTFTETVGI